jgi:septum site-determining protein MinC
MAPDPPLEGWLAELDEWNRRSPGFFRGRPVVLDVSALNLDKEGLAALISDLAARDVRLMGVEGTKAAYLGLGMPPLISGGRNAETTEIPDLPPREETRAARPAEPQPIQAARPAGTRSLLVDEPVRSGQSVIFPEGDVTVVGSVASGAEVIAGGSIHIYGTLRGRAIAGSNGNADARIFCGKLEAELVAIDGLYRMAEDMGSEFRGRAVQTWLEGDAIKMAALV